MGAGLRALLEPEFEVFGSRPRIREHSPETLRGAAAVVEGTEASRLLAQQLDSTTELQAGSESQAHVLLLLIREIDTATARRARHLRESGALPNLRGLLDPESPGERLRAAIRAALQGFYVEPVAQGDAAASDLTTRELELLELVGRGLLNKEIAGELRISENTVKYHLSSLYQKLDAGTRLEAVRAAAERGLISL
jgi:DNA-binding NarL/FixJ family response regulator